MRFNFVVYLGEFGIFESHCPDEAEAWAAAERAAMGYGPGDLIVHAERVR